MRIGIIGAGRVGCSLALSLSKKGPAVSGIYSRNQASAESAAKMLDCFAFGDILPLVEASDTVLITVPDTAISETAQKISRSLGRNGLEGKVFLHCSGALTCYELDCIKNKGGYTGSLHPIQTFPDRMNSWKSMYGITFGFEGTAEAEAAAAEIVGRLDGTMLKLDAEAKSLYHAAACVLSNYMVTLSHTASKMLECAGIEKEKGIRAFMPLLKNTVENINSLGSVGALTGPVSRGDSVTLAAHLEALERSLPEETELYKSLGKATVRLALEKGTINEDKARELSGLLDGACV